MPDKPCRSSVIALAALLFSARAVCAAVSIEEIVRQHEEARRRASSGRLSYRVDLHKSPAYLEARHQQQRAAIESQALAAEALLREKGVKNPRDAATVVLRDLDLVLKLDELRQTGTYEVDCVFDRAQDAVKSITTDTRDLDSLPDAADLKSMGLSRNTTRAIVRDMEVKYEDGPNCAVVDASKDYSLDAERLLDAGFIRREGITATSVVTVRDDPMQPSLLHVVNSDSGSRVEYVLDRAWGLRVTKMRIYRGDTLVSSSDYNYAIWGDDIFLREWERRVYGPSGEVSESETYAVRDVSLNVPIAPEEFEVQYPSNAGVVDRRTGIGTPPKDALPPPRVLQRSVSDLADDLLTKEYAAEQARRFDVDAGLSENRVATLTPGAPAEAPRVEVRRRVWLVVVPLVLLSSFALIAMLLRRRRK